MIRKQARDLCGRDVGRMVSVVDVDGERKEGGLCEVMHHKHVSILLLWDRPATVAKVLPETMVEVRGNG